MSLLSLLESNLPFVILIRDTIEKSSYTLVKHIISQWTLQGRTITIAHTEDTFRRYQESITNAKDRQVIAVDMASDPLGWQSTSDSSVQLNVQGNLVRCTCQNVDNMESVRAAFKKVGEVVSSSTLIIDSLSGLMLHNHSAESIAQLLRDLSCISNSKGKPEYTHIVAVVHADLHDELELRTLEYPVTCVINMIAPPEKTIVSVHGSYTLVHQRASGKASRTTEHFSISDNKFRVYTDLEVQPPKQQEPEDAHVVEIEEEMDKLTEEQKSAKDAVKLPFMKMQQYADADTTSIKGAIYLDQDDDVFVGSDPDDDLDI